MGAGCSSTSIEASKRLKSDEDDRYFGSDIGRGPADVCDFGAVGDGSTDSTHAFHAAIAASLDVFVPNGSFVIHTTLKLRDRQTLRGSGEWISELLFRPEPSLAPTPACAGRLALCILYQGV